MIARLLAVAAAVALLGPLVPTAGGSPAASAFFRTPSRNIWCAWTSTEAVLRCDILSGVRPLPPRPPSCDFDWGAGYRLARTGAARILCVSDSVVASSARVVRYRQTWRGGGFTCTSRTIGLRCRNTAGHGFFLSRQRSFRF